MSRCERSPNWRLRPTPGNSRRADPIQQQPTSPIIITIADPPPSELQGLSDVLLGSLGLAAVFVLGAIVLAAIFAGGLFWWRSRVTGEDSQRPDDLHIV